MTQRSPTDQRLRVLLVEDNLLDAHLIMAILEGEGRYKVTLAQDGIRGAQLASSQEWDLVVTDLNLPGDDGLEVIRTSKRHHPGTPVLTTTGYTEPKYMQAALRTGADDVLVKPVEKEELLRKVLHLVGARVSRRGPLRRTVVAVGARPGDAIAGCGAILVGHRDHGHTVILATLAGARPGDPELLHREEEAAHAIGASHLILHPDAETVPEDHEIVEWLREVLSKHRADTVYAPSAQDRDPDRVRTHHQTLLASGDTPNVYCYPSPTASPSFRPVLFVDVMEYIDRKLSLAGAVSGSPEPMFEEDLVRATARFWGRFDQLAFAEPLEVIRSDA